ncbi:MAG: alpha/beta hydrolase [Alphaproteobacteria bacterium]|nr:MAG: alpha/beta hydrolase [Alphaproteobacteria bacterium]
MSTISRSLQDAYRATHYRVLAPDSRGHGGTRNPADRLDYDQMADDVAGLIAALGLDRPVLVGYSDGAQIGIEFGLRHPGKARAMVLGGVVTRPTEVYLEGLKAWGFTGPDEVDYDRLAAAFGDFFTFIKTAHGRGEADYWQRFLRQIARLWHTLPAYTDAQLAAIDPPTLVITGDRDELDGLGEAQRLIEILPHAELAVVPGAGHDAVTRPVFWDLVEDFLSRHAGA